MATGYDCQTPYFLAGFLSLVRFDLMFLSLHVLWWAFRVVTIAVNWIVLHDTEFLFPAKIYSNMSP